MQKLRLLRVEPRRHVQGVINLGILGPSDIIHGVVAEHLRRRIVFGRNPFVYNLIRRIQRTVLVQIHAVQILVDRLNRDVGLFDQRFDDGQIDFVNRYIKGLVRIEAHHFGQTDQYVVRRAVGRPERPQERIVAEGAPPGVISVGVAVESLVVEDEVTVGTVTAP